jgi:hypothetical protein
MSLEDLPLGVGEIVFGLGADGLEQLGAPLVVEELGLDPLRLPGQTGEHGTGQLRLPGVQVGVSDPWARPCDHQESVARRMPENIQRSWG